MNHLKVVAILNTIEAKIPVINWTANGIRIWPLIRLTLAFELYKSVSVPNSKATPKENLLTNLPAKSFTPVVWLNKVKTKLIAWKNFNKGRIKFRQKNGIFILGFTSNRSNSNNVYFDRIHDPLTSWCIQNNYNPIVLEFNNGVPHASSAMHADYLVKGDQLLWTWQQNNDRKINSLHLESYEQYCQLIEELNLIDSITTKRTAISLLLKRFLTAIDFFGKLLDSGDYKLCLLSTYYDWRGFALTTAANHRNIPTVDLQHGSRNAGHIAYASWSILPEKGWECLPRWFWCWNTSSAEPILKWNNKHKQFHDVIFGGNPWIEIWRKHQFPWTEQQEEQIKPYLGKKNILYSLQPFDEIHMPGVRELMDSIPNDWYLWIRLHPRQPKHIREELKTQLSNFGSANFFVDEISDVPLPLLLLYTDLHLTMWSGVVEEAAEFGVPTIFMHENGVKLFQHYIEMGIAADGTSGNLNDIVRQLITIKYDKVPQNGDYKTALKQLLKKFN